MPNTEERELKKGSGCGLAVVVGLALIFFVLLILLIGESRREKAPTLATPAELFVVPARLRVRVQPSAKSPVIDHATRGEKLSVVESRGAWVKVLTPRKLAGWAERNALEREEARNRRLQRITAIRKLPPLSGSALTRVPLYSGPGLFFSIVGELQPNVRVKVFTRDHDFYAIDAEGDVAYVEVDAVDISSSDAALDVAAADEPGKEPAAEPPATATESAATEPVTETAAAEVAEVPGGVYPAVPSGGSDPEVVDRIVPSYPGAARRAGAEGRVVLRGIVRRNGRIEAVEIVKDQPYGLGEAARSAVRRWRFRPATYRGDAIDVYYTVTVNYKLAE